MLAAMKKVNLSQSKPTHTVSDFSDLYMCLNLETVAAARKIYTHINFKSLSHLLLHSNFRKRPRQIAVQSRVKWDSGLDQWFNQNVWGFYCIPVEEKCFWAPCVQHLQPNSRWNIWFICSRPLVTFQKMLDCFFDEITAKVAVEDILWYRLNVIPTAVFYIFSS